MLRNPKDLVVSQYHFFHTGLLTEEFDGSFEEYFNLFVKGELHYGPFWDHVNDYTERSGFHIVYYEDLIEVCQLLIKIFEEEFKLREFRKDPIEEIRKLAIFLDMTIDDTQLETLIEQISFSNMKKNTDVAFNFESIDAFFLKTVKYFRKGQVGDWKEHLTDEMSDRIENMVREKIKLKKSFKYELPEASN